MINVWLTSIEEEIINDFWRASGAIEPFPRNLERYIALTLPLMVVRLPHLQIRDIHRWLDRRGVLFHFDCTNRRLRGCLIAHRGGGAIFVDGSDTEGEVQFTIAHELGHFLADYIHPRTAALRVHGSSVADILDGVRLPTPVERIASVVTGTNMSIHVDLLERNSAGDVSSDIWRAESRANRMAVAFVAPPKIVLSRLKRPLSLHFAERQKLLAKQLVDDFNLPIWASMDYARALLEMIDQGPSWAKALKIR